MKKLTCLGLFLLVAMYNGPAFGDIIDDLTVTIDGYCDVSSCSIPMNFDTGALGGRGVGYADFNPIGYTWSFSFVTGFPISWHYDGVYEAQFGQGGQFTINGPDNLTFSGFVTQGNAFGNTNYRTLAVDYFGQWSNGLYGDGLVEFRVFEGSPEPLTVHFEAAIVPEPGSLALLVAGAGTCLGWFRRRLVT